MSKKKSALGADFFTHSTVFPHSPLAKSRRNKNIYQNALATANTIVAAVSAINIDAVAQLRVKLTLT